MKLISLELIGEYKGLQSQTFSFSESNDSVIALIGLNGSGKSQLLELGLRLERSFSFHA